MTAIYVRELNGVIEFTSRGLDLIDAIYEIIHFDNGKDTKKVLLGSLSKGTRSLRVAHSKLCAAIGDTNGLDPDDANVKSVPNHTEVSSETRDLVRASVFAAAKNPFLHDMRPARQEAAVEQIRSTALILEGLIEFLEMPNYTV